MFSGPGTLYKATDQQGREHDNDPFIIRNHNPSATGREVNVIKSGNGIFPSVCGAQRERHKWDCIQMFANVGNHDDEI